MTPEQPAGGVRRVLADGRLALVLRWLVGAMVLLSAIPKLIDLEASSVYVVYSYYILPIQPFNVARFAGLIIPYAELLIGIGLITGIFTRLAAAGWTALSLAYLAAKLHVIFVQGRTMDCGCFGGLLPHLAVTQSIWIDVAGIIACVQILVASRASPRLALWSRLRGVAAGVGEVGVGISRTIRLPPHDVSSP